MTTKRRNPGAVDAAYAGVDHIALAGGAAPHKYATYAAGLVEAWPALSRAQQADIALLLGGAA